MNTPLLAAPDDWQEVALDPPSLARFHEITAPALVIVGNRDQPDILAGAHLIATGISGARKVVIPNTAHMLNMEQPAAFNRAVLAFLAEVDVW